MRIIAFDRPGYGSSTQIPFSLVSVADMAIQVADQLGLDQFRTTAVPLDFASGIWSND